MFLALVLAVVCTWGPGGTDLATSTPTYSSPIPVIDTLVGTLRPERQLVWRRARNQALVNWGVPFSVTEEPTRIWDDSIGTTGFADLVTPGAIVLFRNTSSSGQDMGGWDEATGAGLAVYHPWRGWWGSNNFKGLIGTIDHEIGHAIGFGHPTTATGIMGGGNKPNAEEVAAAQTYYGGSF